MAAIVSTHIALLVGSAASGKTEATLRVLQQPHQGKAFFLVPSGLQQRLLKARVRRSPHVGVYQFYGLARLVLHRAGCAVADLSDTMRMMLLRSVLRDLIDAGRLPIFANVAHKRGFISIIGTLIAEAQAAEVAPRALTTASVTPYDAELGIIYETYSAALERLELADIPRRLGLARDALHTNPDLLAGLALLVVDGFDQFNALQLSLLTELTQCAERVLITLTRGAEQRLSHRRFDRTYEQLVERLHPTVSRLEDEAWNILPGRVYVPVQSDLRSPVLSHIEAHLFDLDQPAPVDAGGVVTVIEAADREREVRAALRHVHTMVQQGIPPEQIAILFRTSTTYAPLLREVATEYHLPLALYDGLPLIESPPVVALLTMLRLPLENYPRRALVEVWRSFADGRMYPKAPFCGLDAALDFERAASLLDRVARDSGVSSGLARLRSALERLSAVVPAPVITDGVQFTAIVTPTEAVNLLALLDTFCSWLAPPERATTSDYVVWLQERLPTSDERSGKNGEPPAAGDDLSTLDNQHNQLNQHNQQPAFDGHWSFVLARLSSVLNDLARAASELREPPISFSTFMTELSAALAAARYGRVGPKPGRIAALPALAARGSFFDHVVVLGLVEGEFPLALSTPPIYSRRERAALAQRGVHLPAPDPADERSLFYETVTRARRSLILSRTYLDERGNPLPPSPYLTALCDLAQPDSIIRVRAVAGSAPALDEAASQQEKLVALVQHAESAAPQDEWSVKSNLDGIDDLQAQLAHVLHACQVEKLREGADDSAYGPFEGVLDDVELVAELKKRFGPTHHWSITQFNDYTTCPFRFAASYILRLERRTEPEDGLERAGRGRIFHAILAEAGRQWIRLNHALTAEHEQVVLEIVQKAADEVLADAPTRYGFDSGEFWNWEQADIRQILVRALRRIIRESGDWAQFQPVQVEKSFGLKYSRHPPLSIDTSEGVVLVAGRVDRIDRRDDGALALLDYKSSSTPRPLNETLNGRDVQLAIYLLAVEQLLMPGQRVERAAFLHLGSGKHSRPLTERERPQSLGAMVERVAETVRGVRAGRFPVRPHDTCPTGCAFASICRLNLAKRNAQ